ncbi:hypothetical protein THRCLA_05599 [Thraustotheca clavata]|uniref:Glycosyl transferase CAP10 domain-containing protein n=1 Tax=Thraustotheca clavata TaxID=74557 RepID=A0A1V9ZVJ4_9STRA|nr:hypothetical protein THRCLA_05599 [Thraustotheca clavata]
MDRGNYHYNYGNSKQIKQVFEGLRGFFAWEDETDPDWKAAVEAHGGVPKFATKAECEQFVQQYCGRGSNPDFPNLQHIFTMLVTWEQVRKILFPAIADIDEKYPYVSHHSSLRKENRFADSAVESGITWRTQLPFHRETNRESTIHTLKYLFFHMRCGILVMIRSGKVVLFAPFVNKDYENNWADFLKFDSSDGTYNAYYEEKRNHYRRENIIPDIRKWWANGNIICNEHCKDNRQLDETQYWGDQFLAQLRDMLDDCCKHRDIPDCEFFINKRDYPHLKNNLSEPYGFLFDRDDRNPDEDLPLTQYKFPTYAPIMSFYISNRFADIPFPCSEDWEAATGLVFPPSFQHTHCHNCPCKNKKNCENNWECYCQGDRKYHGIAPVRDLFTASNFKNFDKPWEDKVNTAFFRGTATGGGTTIDTNQRLHLAHLSNLWKTESEYLHLMEPLPYLDAEITAWNLRDKKIAKSPMTFVRKERFQGRGEFTAGKHHYIPMYEQSKYKYILYVEGHCAANRYAFLMRLGGVILKVTSKCVADEMWYTPLLQPMVDHVPIKADLSDLAEKIQWCRDNDDKCREIANRAKWLYDNYVSKQGIHDYMELITTQIAQRYVPSPVAFGYKRPLEDISQPSISPTSQHQCIGGPGPHQSGRWCRRCKDDEADERVKRQKRDAQNEKYGANKPLRYDNRGRGNYNNRNYGNRGGNYKLKSSGPPPEKQCRLCRRKMSICKCTKH